MKRAKTKDELVATIQRLLGISDEQWMMATPCSSCRAGIGEPCAINVRGRRAHARRVDRGHECINSRGLLRAYIADVEKTGYSASSTYDLLRRNRIYKIAMKAGYLTASEGA